jgi:uncharacterized membrane-anchored protein
MTQKGSLFAAISEGIASHEQSVRLQRLEIGMGFLGFFALFSLITTVVAVLSGRSGVAEALVSAVLVGLLYLVFRQWQAVGRVIAEDAARRGRHLGR